MLNTVNPFKSLLKRSNWPAISGLDANFLPTKRPAWHSCVFNLSSRPQGILLGYSSLSDLMMYLDQIGGSLAMLLVYSLEWKFCWAQSSILMKLLLETSQLAGCQQNNSKLRNSTMCANLDDKLKKQYLTLIWLIAQNPLLYFDLINFYEIKA